MALNLTEATMNDIDRAFDDAFESWAIVSQVGAERVNSICRLSNEEGYGSID